LIQRLFDFGINRLSIGIQSLNTEVLSRLERSTDLKQTLKALEYAASGPIHNWNADFIYGIPGQSNETLERDINQLTDFNPKHISAYALTMERNILGDKTISDKRQYTHQNFLWEFLPSRGYEQYEISNFSKKGYECIHNLSVWKYRPYLSLGTSGHSFFNDRRFRTISDIERYLSEPFCDILIEQSSLVIPDLFISILRLNKSQGMSLFNRLLSVEESRKLKALLKKFEKNNWVKFLNNGFKITREGLNFSNIMLEEVYRDL
jgi:oxygen-independent coproporphyrinogen-3 oxidase